MEFTEKQKQKICNYIKQSLSNVKLKYLFIDNDTGNRLLLIDFLSTGNTIEEGKEEIENIVEQIYFNMDKWNI